MIKTILLRGALPAPRKDRVRRVGMTFYVSETSNFGSRDSILTAQGVTLAFYRYSYNAPAGTKLYAKVIQRYSDGSVSEPSLIHEFDSSVNVVRMSISHTQPGISYRMARKGSYRELRLSLYNLDSLQDDPVTSVIWRVESRSGMVLYTSPVTHYPDEPISIDETLLASGMNMTVVAEMTRASGGWLGVTTNITNTYDGIYHNYDLAPQTRNHIDVPNPNPSCDKYRVTIRDFYGSLVSALVTRPESGLNYQTGVLDAKMPYRVYVTGYSGNATLGTVLGIKAFPKVHKVRSEAAQNNTIDANVSIVGLPGFTKNTKQSTAADVDDVFYLATPGTRMLEGHKIVAGVVLPAGVSHDLGPNSLAANPIVSITRLYNGDLLVEHNTVTPNGVVLKFSVMAYDPNTKAMSLITGTIYHTASTTPPVNQWIWRCECTTRLAIR